MTNWKITNKEFIPANNITRVTLTEEVNWQRVVVNIAGDLVTDSDESIINKAIGEFIKRERPDFAQEIVDQSVDEIRKDLAGTKQVVADMKEQVDTLVVSISNLTKEQEEALADKYDPWEVGKSYSIGDKVHYESVNYEVLQEHTSQGDWLPSDTPSMYKVIKNDDIETDEGTVEVIDEFEANATNPYSIGDKVIFEGKVYESTIDNNVWSPTDHPQGWKEIK